MIYCDQIYGKVEFPLFVEELSQSQQVQRLRGISQDVLSEACLPWRAPNRFDHSMGVCFLAMIVAEKNRLIAQDADNFVAAALLHDTGNPTLSHLAEPFLEKLTGKNGESFLPNRLRRTEAGMILKKYGLDRKKIVGLVTGSSKEPLAVALNGSIDIDNIDNLNRYWFAKEKQTLFDGKFIASCLRFEQTGWGLLKDCLEEAKKWQRARAKVYGVIYGQPHLAIAMMVFRALDIAFSLGEVTEDFFELTDDRAIDYLANCNGESSRLIVLAKSRQWHQRVFAVETTDPSAKFKKLAKKADNRGAVADCVCDLLGLPKSAVCVYLGKGRDRRKIGLPFLSGNTLFQLRNGDTDPIYRGHVYLDPRFEDKKSQVIKLAESIF